MQRKWKRRWQRLAKVVVPPVAAGMIGMMMSACGQAWASGVVLPTGGQIVAGSGAISQSGNTMTVNQTTGSMVANWRSFSIGQGAAVNFVQPSASAVALNRVVGNNASAIYGTLTANGQVYLVNPSGVLFAPGSQVNVGGLVASTLNISDSDFMNGRYLFEKNGTASPVINQGDITAADHAVFLGPQVKNEGTVAARVTALAAGSKVSLDFSGDKLLNVTVDTAAAGSSVTNSGTITAPGGLVLMTTGTKDALLNTVVNNSGVIRAQTVNNVGGVIKLIGSTVNVAGTLDASAPNGGNGGFIDTSGAKVNIAPTTVVTTAAPSGKTGTWLIDPDGFTIAATGGDMTGAYLSSRLAATNVEIQSASGGGTGGSINVNDAVSWSANELKLTATNDVNINAVMTASGTASLDLEPGSGKVNMGFNADGSFKGRVDFPGRSGTGFLTINGHGYTVINSLGAAGSTTGTDLQGINGNLAGYYALGSDIDASATSGWNAGAGFAPMGSDPFSSGTPFTGSFDGLGHTISSLSINRPDGSDVGLFGYSSGIIRNLGLAGVNITAYGYAGGLVGENVGSIANSYVSGTVDGGGCILRIFEINGARMVLMTSVGGLVGLNGGSITNSHSSGTVVGNYTAGGLVGCNESSISKSYSTSIVVVKENAGLIILGGNPDERIAYYAPASAAGGLVGWNQGSIADSYSSGGVSGWQESSVGGLVGMNYSGMITNSYSRATVSGFAGLVYPTLLFPDPDERYCIWDVNVVGGLVGSNLSGGSIANSYSTGSVSSSGYSNVGGLVGRNIASSITNSYSTGLVEGSYYVGGLLGYNFAGTITNSYWDIDTSGKNGGVGNNRDPGSSIGLYSSTPGSSAFSQSSYTGFDFTSANPVWCIYEGYTYPLLKVFLTPLTVTANDVSRTYNGTNYAGGAGVTYSVSPDPTKLFGIVSYSGDSQGARNAGTYAITPTGLYSSQQGYDITVVAGTLTINKAVLTISTDSVTKTYDGTTAAAGSAIATGGTQLYGTDTLSGGSFAFTDKNAGTGKTVTVSGVTVNDGNGGNNYTVTYADNTTSTINKAALTITTGDVTKTYDGTTAATGSAAATGGTQLYGTDTLSGGSFAFTDKNAGTGKTVTVSGVTVNDGNGGNNYTVTYTDNTTSTINKAALTVTANNATKTQGQANPAFTATYSGLIGSDTAASVISNLTFTTAATTISPAGTYTITPNGVLISTNYTVSYVNGTLTVNSQPASYTGAVVSAVAGLGGPGGLGGGFSGGGFGGMGLGGGGLGGGSTDGDSGPLYTIIGAGLNTGGLGGQGQNQ